MIDYSLFKKGKKLEAYFAYSSQQRDHDGIFSSELSVTRLLMIKGTKQEEERV